MNRRNAPGRADKLRPTWKTRDGRIYVIEQMADTHLENTIRYLERRGVQCAMMTPEEREQDPVANAEYNMGVMNDFLVEKYRQLLAEKGKRLAEVTLHRAAMAASRPGDGAPKEGAGGGGQGGGNEWRRPMRSTGLCSGSSTTTLLGAIR